MKKYLKLKNEVAVVVGVLLSVALTVQDALLNGNADWRNLVPIVAGAIVRQFVYGPVTVQKIDEARVSAEQKAAEAEEIWKKFLEELRKDEAEGAA